MEIRRVNLWQVKESHDDGNLRYQIITFRNQEKLYFPTYEDLEKYVDLYGFERGSEHYQFYKSLVESGSYVGEFPEEPAYEITLDDGTKLYTIDIFELGQLPENEVGKIESPFFTVNYEYPLRRKITPGWFYLNKLLPAGAELKIGVGHQSNMGVVREASLTVSEFLKFIRKQSSFYTPFLFKNGKRRAANAYLIPGSYTVFCVDFDDIEQYILYMNEFKDSLLHRLAYYIEHISRSGEGYHIYFIVKVSDEKVVKSLLSYLALEFKDVADVSVFEPARLIFTSPNQLKEVAKITIPRFFEDIKFTRLESYDRFVKRVEKIDITEDGKRALYRNERAHIPVRTYVDDVDLLEYLKGKHSKKGSVYDLSIDEDLYVFEDGSVEKEGGDQPTLEASHEVVRDGNFLRRKFSGLLEALKGKLPINISLDTSSDKPRIQYIQVSISPDEESPMDMFWYPNNPCFFYFQSENSLRHLGNLRFVCHPTQKRFHTIHASYLAPLFYRILTNYGYKGSYRKFLNFLRKLGFSEHFIVTPVERIAQLLIEPIKELKRKKVVLLKNHFPKEIISKNTTFKAFRKELERLGIKFIRTKDGLAITVDTSDIDLESYKANGKGLPKFLLDVVRSVLSQHISQPLLEELMEIAEENFIRNQSYWVKVVVVQTVRELEKRLRQRLENLMVEYQDRLVSGLAYFLTHEIAPT